MTKTRELARATCQLPAPDRGTYLEGSCHCCHGLCATCHPALILDAGRVEIAHESTCPADRPTAVIA